jgi:hypothetical protein
MHWLRARQIHTEAQFALSVRPGDAISATLCLQTDAAGTANYFLANETTFQTVNFTIATGFPPAHTINAGVTRDSEFNGLRDPLARFGVVYFDELSAFAPVEHRNSQTACRPQWSTPMGGHWRYHSASPTSHSR